jgi:DNA-directed RNA polymerase subunit RPC12/RpoP
MKYICDQCEKEVDDYGPYELSNGDYVCLDCWTDMIERAELYYDT